MPPIRVPSIDPDNPPADPYIFGRWHKDRASLKGYLRELRLALQCPIVPKKRRGFIIFSRARSGSTLLVRLMDQLPSVWCDSEILSHAVMCPTAYAMRSAKRRTQELYGFKVLSYQIAEVQALQDPLQFFRELTQRGFAVIHLTRAHVWQALSIQVASDTSQYHVEQASEPDAKSVRRLHHVDVASFVRRLRWNLELATFERELMSEVPHLHVHYDRDLLHSEAQQQTIDSICDFLGTPRQTVRAELKKILGVTLDQIASNAEEVRGAIASLIDEGLVARSEVAEAL